MRKYVFIANYMDIENTAMDLENSRQILISE